MYLTIKHYTIEQMTHLKVYVGGDYCGKLTMREGAFKYLDLMLSEGAYYTDHFYYAEEVPVKPVEGDSDESE